MCSVRTGEVRLGFSGSARRPRSLEVLLRPAVGAVIPQLNLAFVPPSESVAI